MSIEGYVKIGTRTKELIKYLSSEDIAIIQHDDIDILAAEALINSRLKAVINTGKSMTGGYCSRGTAKLVTNNIKLYDVNINIAAFKDSDFVRIKGNDLILNNSCLYSNSCQPVNNEYIQQRILESGYNHRGLLHQFIDNTLLYAEKEKDCIIDFSDYPDIGTNINGRYTIVVVRSTESKEALLSLRSFIDDKKPILIGVDGGVDTIISCGHVPDILIGDMDSVSDVGIYRSKEIILHTYMDGRCPCLSRMEALNIKYKMLAMPGTSEDVALLLAYDKGASKIILIGGHSCMTDFLERGRSGMGSTLVTRLKIEDRLIDYKNIMKLQDMMK
ncbi:MAG: thiamine pyrophosphokinae catalytic protein, partial [Clostridia bacterium]|nr:thiamine pyrophosphokinae catalytic protein [Clostridia bacterium]